MRTLYRSKSAPVTTPASRRSLNRAMALVELATLSRITELNSAFSSAKRRRLSTSASTMWADAVLVHCPNSEVMRTAARTRAAMAPTNSPPTTMHRSCDLSCRQGKGRGRGVRGREIHKDRDRMKETE